MTTTILVARCCLIRRFITPPVNGYIAIATLHTYAVQSQEQPGKFFGLLQTFLRRAA